MGAPAIQITTIIAVTDDTGTTKTYRVAGTINPAAPYLARVLDNVVPIPANTAVDLWDQANWPNFPGASWQSIIVWSDTDLLLETEDGSGAAQLVNYINSVKKLKAGIPYMLGDLTTMVNPSAPADGFSGQTNTTVQRLRAKNTQLAGGTTANLHYLIGATA